MKILFFKLRLFIFYHPSQFVTAQKLPGHYYSVYTQCINIQRYYVHAYTVWGSFFLLRWSSITYVFCTSEHLHTSLQVSSHAPYPFGTIYLISSTSYIPNQPTYEVVIIYTCELLAFD